MDINKIIVWLVVGTFAGTLAGRLLTFSKKGFGFWSNIGVGMVGAVVGDSCSGCFASTSGWVK